MAVTNEDIALLTRIVGRFENSGDPYEGVAGDFDRMGISCGVLQWNIGSNSLQPIVRSVGRPHVMEKMPHFGAAMWRACTSSVAAGLQIVRQWQKGTSLKPAPAAELRALMRSAPMRAQQDIRIRAIAERADAWASSWATSRQTGTRTPLELTWFFDVATQNGSMKGLGFADVQSFKQASTPDRVDDLICDWLASLGSNFWGFRDSRKNAQLWRDSVPAGNLDLLVLSYLRSQKSTQRVRGDVLNRKGTLALRRGHVHGTLFDLTDLL